MSALTGTGGLIRLILRRDRFIMPVWIFFLALVPSAGVAAFEELYPTAAARQAFARLAGANPALTALYGKLYSSGIGGLIAWRYSLIPVFAMLAGFLTVIRHTRTEEEAGRRELLGSAVVSRHAPLTAALLVTFAANIVLAALIAGSLIGQGLPAAGSVALGLAFGGGGAVFAAVGAVAAQLTQNAGSARGISGAILGASFLLRAVGDVSEPLSWLAWLSPLGWSEQVRAFGGDQFWPAALFGSAFLALSVAAFALSAKRDSGSGILPARLGPASTTGLGGPLALAWRLQRTLLIGWLIGISIFALFIGGVADSFGDILQDSPQLKQYFAAVGGEAGLTDIGLAVFVNTMAVLLSAYAIQSALRLRAEEVGLRAQPVLATGVGRLRFAGAHLAFSIAGPAVLLALAGLLIGLTYGSLAGEVGRQVSRLVPAALVQLPAVWVIAGVAGALYGLWPRLAAPATWALLSAFVITGLFGEVLRLPDRLIDASPFNQVPKLPSEEFTAMPVVWLAALAAALIGVGLIGFRRRDIG